MKIPEARFGPYMIVAAVSAHLQKNCKNTTTAVVVPVEVAVVAIVIVVVITAVVDGRHSE